MSMSRRSWKGPVAVIMTEVEWHAIFGWPEPELRDGERAILGQDGTRLVVPDHRGGRAEDKPEPEPPRRLK